jgi:hypothetical protein
MKNNYIPPGKVCGRNGCNEHGINKANGNGTTLYCEKHYRFYRMRTDARRSSKVVPTWEQLDEMLLECLNEHGELGGCPSCGQQMQWKAGADKKIGPTISLQHNLDGTMCFICLSCNVGHGRSRAGDRYLEKTLVGFKYCGDCDTVRPLEQFRRDRRTGTGFGSFCRDCSNKRRKKHREAKKQEVLV